MAAPVVAGGASSGTGAALAGAAGSIGGGLLGGLLDFPIQKSFNVRQTRHARKWQEYMSNTQYQRAVKDLEAAGLNPMLAYTQGGAGYSGYEQAQAPDVGMEVDIGKAISTGQQARLMGLEVENLKQVVKKSTADALSAESLADYNKWSNTRQRALAEISGIQATADAATANAKSGMENAKVLSQEARIREAGAASAQVLKDMRGTDAGKALLILREVLNSVK